MRRLTEGTIIDINNTLKCKGKSKNKQANSWRLWVNLTLKCAKQLILEVVIIHGNCPSDSLIILIYCHMSWHHYIYRCRPKRQHSKFIFSMKRSSTIKKWISIGEIFNFPWECWPNYVTVVQYKNFERALMSLSKINKPTTEVSWDISPQKNLITSLSNWLTACTWYPLQIRGIQMQAEILKRWRAKIK